MVPETVNPHQKIQKSHLHPLLVASHFAQVEGQLEDYGPDCGSSSVHRTYTLAGGDGDQLSLMTFAVVSFCPLPLKLCLDFLFFG